MSRRDQRARGTEGLTHAVEYSCLNPADIELRCCGAGACPCPPVARAGDVRDAEEAAGEVVDCMRCLTRGADA